MIQARYLAVLFLVACAADEEIQVAAPDLGKADGIDVSDRRCTVWLDHVTPTQDGIHRVALDGELRAPAGAEAGVLFRIDQGPWQAQAAVETTPGVYGFQLSALQFQSVELVPLVTDASGKRTFDHNRNLRPFDNYVLSGANAYTVLAVPGLCDGSGATLGHHATLTTDLRGSVEVSVLMQEPAPVSPRSTSVVRTGAIELSYADLGPTFAGATEIQAYVRGVVRRTSANSNQRPERVIEGFVPLTLDGPAFRGTFAFALTGVEGDSYDVLEELSLAFADASATTWDSNNDANYAVPGIAIRAFTH